MIIDNTIITRQTTPISIHWVAEFVWNSVYNGSGGSRISRRKGRRPCKGRRLPRWLCFENFVCQNESIWILERGACPLDLPINCDLVSWPTATDCWPNQVKWEVIAENGKTQSNMDIFLMESSHRCIYDKAFSPWLIFSLCYPVKIMGHISKDFVMLGTKPLSI